MSQNQNNDIIIDSVDGPVEGLDLMGCFFVYDSSNHTYTFFDKSGKRLKTGLEPGKHFHFKLPDFHHMKWRLSISKDSTATVVTGKWKEKSEHAEFGDEEWDPDQSYQAQAGGAGADDANAASATAK